MTKLENLYVALVNMDILHAECFQMYALSTPLELLLKFS